MESMGSKHCLGWSLLLVGVVFLGAGGQAKGDYSLEDIRSAYRERTAACRSVHLAWTSRYTMLSGNGAKDAPALPASFDGTGELVMSKDGELVTLDRELWHGDKKCKVRSVEISVLGKSELTTYAPERACGEILPRDAERGVPEWIDLAKAACGVSAEFLADPKWTLLRHEADGDGRDLCVVGNTGRTDPNSKDALGREVYLDPKLGFAPVRWISVVPSGIITDEVRVEYKRDAKGNLVPKRLKTRRTDPATGQERSSESINIRSVKLNRPVDKDAFVVKFAPGTVVRDRVNGKEYKVPGAEGTGQG